MMKLNFEFLSSQSLTVRVPDGFGYADLIERPSHNTRKKQAGRTVPFLRFLIKCPGNKSNWTHNFSVRTTKKKRGGDSGKRRKATVKIHRGNVISKHEQLKKRGKNSQVCDHVHRFSPAFNLSSIFPLETHHFHYGLLI